MLHFWKHRLSSGLSFQTSTRTRPCLRKRTLKAGVLSEMRLILQIGARFRREGTTAQRKGPGSGDGIIDDLRMGHRCAQSETRG